MRYLALGLVGSLSQNLDTTVVTELGIPDQIWLTIYGLGIIEMDQ